MTIEKIKNYITENFEKVNVIEKDGSIFFMYDGNDKFPFATIVTADDAYDYASNLNRDGYYRLNIGVDKRTFEALFKNLPKKKGFKAYLDSGIDFTEEDKIMPHPVYGSMYWISIINPTSNSFESLKEYLALSFNKISK
jgi:Family of unknown function (DUF6194)